jgi:hypothetical protein
MGVDKVAGYKVRQDQSSEIVSDKSSRKKKKEKDITDSLFLVAFLWQSFHAYARCSSALVALAFLLGGRRIGSYLAVVLIKEVYDSHEVFKGHYMRLGKVLQVWKLFRLGAERTQEILGQPNGIDLPICKLTVCRYRKVPTWKYVLNRRFVI